MHLANPVHKKTFPLATLQSMSVIDQRSDSVEQEVNAYASHATKMGNIESIKMQPSEDEDEMLQPQIQMKSKPSGILPMHPLPEINDPIQMEPEQTISETGEPVVQRMSWTDSGCELTANYTVGCSFLGYGDHGWTDERESTFQSELENILEETFNNNPYHITPSAARQDTNWFQENILDRIPGFDYNCPCTNGYTPRLDISVHGRGAENMSNDWGAYVFANPEGEVRQSRNAEGTGYLDEGDVHPKASGQYGAVHEFGHFIGLHHPGHNVDLPPGIDEYEYTGQDEHGRDVDGPVDLMGEGMGLRPFYFESWLDHLNNQYPGCNFIIS